jgi:hypothetical protein
MDCGRERSLYNVQYIRIYGQIFAAREFVQKIDCGNWSICPARGLSDKVHFPSTQAFMKLLHVRNSF